MTKKQHSDSTGVDILKELAAGSIELGSNGRLRMQDGRDLAAVLLGRRGGLKGGANRAKALTAEQRKDIAQRAARARWDRKVEDER